MAREVDTLTSRMDEQTFYFTDGVNLYKALQSQGYHLLTIGPLSTPTKQILQITSDTDGMFIYGVNSDGDQVYTISKTTGLATSLSKPTGVSNIPTAWNLYFDGQGTLYLVGSTGGTTYVYVVAKDGTASLNNILSQDGGLTYPKATYNAFLHNQTGPPPGEILIAPVCVDGAQSDAFGHFDFLVPPQGSVLTDVRGIALPTHHPSDGIASGRGIFQNVIYTIDFDNVLRKRLLLEDLAAQQLGLAVEFSFPPVPSLFGIAITN